ncbi:MAG TPA: MBL fold metallo-hydrolase [Candidatus Saccharibacteria bacterium]|nr:MBL fold metallo-hydrolase [Candidatus Saccharibacteria bacterium]
MFEIEYKGANCVTISTKKLKLVIDPKLSIVGLKDITYKDAVQLITENRFIVNNIDSKLIIDGPGEYGIADFDIRGVPARRHIDKDSDRMLSTIYRIEVGESRIGVIGNISNKLDDDQLESIGVIDILIIPVGGNGYTLDAIDATKLVRIINPKIVIPIHYSDKSINYEVPQDSLEKFIAEMAVPVETMPKYKFKQISTATSGMQIIEITRSN